MATTLPERFSNVMGSFWQKSPRSTPTARPWQASLRALARTRGLRQRPLFGAMSEPGREAQSSAPVPVPRWRRQLLAHPIACALALGLASRLFFVLVATWAFSTVEQWPD